MSDVVADDGMLRSIPQLLRNDVAVTSLIGAVDGTVAIPEVARGVAIAALAQLSGRRPLVVACPTTTMATQLHAELRAFLRRDDVLLFPAWETLPFERVSPSVDTMSRRLEVLWRLQDPDRHPQVVVTRMRALLHQRGPNTASVQPVIVSKGSSIDPEDLLRTLVRNGYRREEIVEHRGEAARRGAIVDVFPPTRDAPVRIDLCGDEVDRLTEFSLHDQRSYADLDQLVIFPARELVLDDATRRRAHDLIAAEPWGREHWE
ncbi:MAG: transcription-repair coupling factor, partial [Actinomycetota bacterium]